MLKAVYSWDKDNHFDTIKLVEDDYQLASNETFDKPEDGLYEPITRTATGWVGTPKEEWEAAQPVIPVKPSTQQQMIAHLGQQVQQQQQMIAHLGQQLSAQGGTTND